MPQTQPGKNAIDNERKKYLRSIGHNLKPVVTVAGNGLSESVMAEIERAINDHELIKIKLVFDDRSLRTAAIEEICDRCHAHPIQVIGKTALLYRKSDTPNPRLSNILRH